MQVFLMKITKQIPEKYNTLLAVLSALLTGSAFLRVYEVSTAADIALWIFLILIPFYKKAFGTDDAKLKNVHIFCGMFFMLAYTAANLAKFLAYDSAAETIFALFCTVVGLYVFFKNAVKLLYIYLCGKSFLCTDSKRTIPAERAKVFWVSFCLITICRIPYFMYLFPGNVLYDSVMQLLMTQGRIHLSNHHPVPHTLFIKYFFELGIRLFGSQTAGVALYSMAQCLLMTLAFSYIVTTFYRLGVKKAAVYIALAYYCIMPYHNDYSFTMLKDVMFGGITAVFCVTLWRMLIYTEAGKKISVYEMLMFCVFGILFCLFRSNAFFAYLIAMPFIAAAFFKSSKKIAVASVLIFAAAAVIKGPVYNLCDIHHTDIVESYSLPAQHIARVIKDGGELDDSQRELLSQIVDIDRIPETYYPSIADPIKELIREKENIDYLEKNKAKYFKLWLELGLRYPKSYLLAQIDETSGFFYPDSRSWVYGTIDFSGEKYGFNIHKLPLMSEKTYTRFTDFVELYRKIHYVGLFWSIGMMCWFMIFFAGLCIVRGKRKYIIVYLPVMAVIATLIIATPVNTEFRYAYSLFTTMPIFCILPFINKKDAEKTSCQ